MGRTRTKSKKQKLLTFKTPAEDEASSSQPTLSSLVDKAQLLITQCDYDLANLFIKRILHRSPNHAEARELLGIVQLETGLADEAKQTFETLIPPHPDAASPPPHSAYLYLAELSDKDPQAALQYYKSALDLLLAQKEHLHGEEESDIKEVIVRVLVSMVEVWMDPSYDLCFDPAADATCEELVNLALQMDPENVEALQALASVRISQDKLDESKQCLEQTWARWKDLDLDDPKGPSIQTRLSAVKLFLEVGLFTPALATLQGIISSDDQNVEAWYLEGWTFYCMAERADAKMRISEDDAFEELSWEELAQDSRDCLESCRSLHVNLRHPDPLMLEHVVELIAKLDARGIKPSPEDEDNDPADGEDIEGDDTDDDVEMN